MPDAFWHNSAFACFQLNITVFCFYDDATFVDQEELISSGSRP